MQPLINKSETLRQIILETSRANEPFLMAFTCLSLEEQLAVLIQLAELKTQHQQYNILPPLQDDLSSLIYVNIPNRQEKEEFLMRVVAQSQIIDTHTTARQLFLHIFGKEADVVTPPEIISVIRQRFDEFRSLRCLEIELRKKPQRQADVLMKTKTGSLDELYEKTWRAKRTLIRCVQAVQPFIVEDLSFIQDRAEDRGSHDDIETILSTWKVHKNDGPMRITKNQKEILRGVITIRSRQ